MTNRLSTALLCTATICCCLPSVGFALADVAGAVEITTGNFVPPGTLARVVLTITNNGPDPEQSAVMGTYYVATFGLRTIEVLPTPETAPCLVQYTDFTLPPPGISTVFVTVQTLQTLDPGQSLACVVGLITYPEAPEVIHQLFGFGFPNSDADPSNNNVVVDIRTRVAAIAVPGGSAPGTMLLVVGLALTGLLRLRRRMLTLSTAAPGGKQKTESGERRAEGRARRGKVMIALPGAGRSQAPAGASNQIVNRRH